MVITRICSSPRIEINFSNLLCSVHVVTSNTYDIICKLSYWSGTHVCRQPLYETVDQAIHLGLIDFKTDSHTRFIRG
jgi:hypothetical protein